MAVNTQTGDDQLVRVEEHLLLHVPPEVEPVVRRGGDQQAGGQGADEQGDRVDGLVEVRRPRECLLERQDQQEREEDLDAWQRDAKLVEKLDELAIDSLLLALVGHDEQGYAS